MIPPGWAVVGQAEYAGHEAELESRLAQMAREGMPSDIGVLLQQRILSGNIEFFYPEAKPHDKINVQVSRGQVAPIGTDVSAYCDSLPEQKAARFGRQIAFYECSLRVLGRNTALVIESEGINEGSLLIVYHLNHSPGMLLTIGATLRADAADRLRPSITAFVESITFPER